MNIYALKGFKVKATKDSIKSGDEYYSNIAKQYLEENSVYTIKKTKVNNSHTTVELNEIEGINFSSMSFVDVNKQSEENNKKHPDWATWNTDEGYEEYLRNN